MAKFGSNFNPAVKRQREDEQQQLNKTSYGVIKLRCSNGKEQVASVGPVKGRNGMFAPCVRRVDADGNMILSEQDKVDLNNGKVFIAETETIDIKDGTTFDLADPFQNAWWQAIHNHFLIAPSRDAQDEDGNYLIDGTTNGHNYDKPRYGFAEYYVEIPGVQAQKKIDMRTKILKASQFVLEDPQGDRGRYLVAKVFGHDMIGQPSSEVTQYLLDMAEREPDKIMQIYTGGELQLKLILIDAKERGVIRKQNGIYVYGEDGDVLLGSNDAAILKWMMEPKNQKTFDLIKKEIYNLDVIKE